MILDIFFFFFQAEDGIRDPLVTGVQTCALPIYGRPAPDLRDPHRARDDRQGPVRAAPRRRVRGAGLRRGGAGTARDEARGRAQAAPKADAATVPLAGPGAATARAGRRLEPQPRRGA